jgi:hypothetical protein
MGGVPHQLVRYVARFDRREYWLAHEELEELWLVDRRDIFKGLIQIAAGFLHIERENWRGAQRLLTTALRYLSAVPDRCEGLDIATVRSLTAAALELATRLVDGEESAFDESLKFSLAPLFDGKMTEVIIEDAELPYRVRRYDEGYRATSKSGADRQRRSAPEVPPTGSAGGSR